MPEFLNTSLTSFARHQEEALLDGAELGEQLGEGLLVRVEGQLGHAEPLLGVTHRDGPGRGLGHRLLGLLLVVVDLLVAGLHDPGGPRCLHVVTGHAVMTVTRLCKMRHVTSRGHGVAVSGAAAGPTLTKDTRLRGARRAGPVLVLHTRVAARAALLTPHHCSTQTLAQSHQTITQ